MFGDWNRPDRSPARSGETTIEFLDRAAGAFWARIRVLMNDWIERYPDEARADDVGRLRSDNGVDFRSAFWELFLFHLMTSMGGKVKCHPQVPWSTRRPDFEVDGLGQSFLVEAKVVEPDEESRERSVRREEIWDGLNDRVRSEQFFLHVEIIRSGNSSPPTSSLCAEVETWLPTLEPAMAATALEDGGLDALPTTTWVDDNSGWEVRLSAIPKSSHHPDDRIVGMGGVEALYTNDREAIRSALRKKYAAYGAVLDRPLVVALGFNRIGVDEVDITDALFGDEQVTITGIGDRDLHMSRATNGLLYGRAGPRAARLSAILTCDLAQPWNLAVVRPALWRNPWAAHPLAVRFPNALTHEVVDDGVRHVSPSATTAEVLGLPEGWPGPEPAFERE
jgi:hypothetical protein